MEEKKVETTKNDEQQIATPEPKKELEAIEVGKIEEEKKGSPILIGVFFFVLVAAVIGLPYIEPFLDKIRGVEEEQTPNNNGSNNNKQDEDEGEEIKYYSFDTAEVIFEDLKLTDIKMNGENGYVLSLKAISNTSGAIYLLNTNYYIEVYNDQKTLLERIKFDNETTILPSISSAFTYEIGSLTFETGTQFAIVSKEVIDYPEVNLTPDSNGRTTITCTKGTSEYVYLYNSEELYQIENTENYSRSIHSENYSAILASKKNESASLNNVEGVSSNLLETSEEFVVKTIVDNTSVAKTSLLNNKFYSKDALTKVIIFEMQSMRYVCK